VSNTRHPDAAAECTGLTVPIGDFAAGKRLYVIVAYRVTCPPGNEERAARALSKGNNPQEQLNGLVGRWIGEYTAGREVDFLAQQYADRLNELAQEIRKRAGADAGLVLEPRLRAQGEDKLGPISIGRLHIPVRVTDCREELDLELTARVGVDPINTMAALLDLPRVHRIEEQIRAQVTDFVLRQVRLHDFEHELGDTVKRRLTEHLNRELQPHGRRIEFLALKGQQFGAPNQKRVDHDFEIHPHEYPEPVKAHTSLLLELRDTGVYVAAGSPDIEAWARKAVTEVADRCFFKVTYVELSLQLDAKKTELEKGVKAEAAKIGFEVTQLTTVTDLLVDVLRDDFAVDVEGSFATAAANIAGCLAIHLRLRIPDPRPLANLFNRKVDVEQSIREEIQRRVADVLHTTHPESFYLFFDVPQEGEQEAVGARLRKAVKKNVETRFHAEVSDIVTKQIEDELITLYRKLREEARSFQVEVKPLGGADPVSFGAIFRVDGVDHDPKGWNAFNLRRPTLDKLERAFVTTLTVALAGEDAQTLLDSDETVRVAASSLVETSAKEEFGLLVALTGWVRRPTGREDWEREQRGKTQEWVGQLKDIERQRLLMAHQQAAELGQEEIALLRGDIAALQAHYRRLVESGETADADSMRTKIKELNDELNKKLETSVDVKRSLGQIRSPGLLLGRAEQATPFLADERSENDRHPEKLRASTQEEQTEPPLRTTPDRK
jgi:hypothetical protein